MKTTTLQKLIDDSDLNQIQKNINKGFILRAEDAENKKQEDRDLIETVYGKRAEDVVLSTEDVKIFKIRETKDEWDIKYPYRAIYFKDGKWLRTNTVSPTLEVMFLVYLENKYIGVNSQFTDFAMRMLEIKFED